MSRHVSHLLKKLLSYHFKCVEFRLYLDYIIGHYVVLAWLSTTSQLWIGVSGMSLLCSLQAFSSSSPFLLLYILQYGPALTLAA
ncbi:hypothetical protein HYQ46_002685 [Verticillium longisporum]|nr:hypothetical protein HYQ46_002685 [Verticillium longisporum]